MRNKQVKELKKAIKESLKGNNFSKEKYEEVFNAIYKQAKKKFKNTPHNEKNEIKI